MHGLNLQVVDASEFENLKSMYEAVCGIAKTALEENKALKTKEWLNSHEVAEMTGYAEPTIREKKAEIGFRMVGSKDLKFKRKDVLAWMETGYNAPRKRKYN